MFQSFILLYTLNRSSVGASHLPDPWKKRIFFVMLGSFDTFPPVGGPFSPCGDLICPYEGPCPSPTKLSAGVQLYLAFNVIIYSFALYFSESICTMITRLCSELHIGRMLNCFLT